MGAKINKSSVDKLKPGQILSDTEVKGFVVRRLQSGVISFGLRYRVSGRQRWLALGLYGSITPDKARKLAKKRAGEVADNRDPVAERAAARLKSKEISASTVDAMLDTYLERQVRKNLRSAREVERAFKVYVRPRIGAKSIYELRRRDIVEMLDAVEDGNGPVMADRTLAYLRRAFSWHAARDGEFNSPIVRGMARTKPVERARKRMLDDQEIRDVWKALDEADVPACFLTVVRVLLLTAQRREEVSRMTWQEIQGDTWIIPAVRGDKQGHKTADLTGDKVVPLPSAVFQLLGTRKRRGFVISTRKGKLPFSGFSKAKRKLDSKILEIRKAERRKPMPPWVLHDLRRTARSLMSRAGVDKDIAERVLGHTIPGVRGVYDRHEYLKEKRDALEQLAALVAQILDPSHREVQISRDRSQVRTPNQFESIPSG
jgi:integrase